MQQEIVARMLRQAGIQSGSPLRQELEVRQTHLLHRTRSIEANRAPVRPANSGAYLACTLSRIMASWLLSCTQAGVSAQAAEARSRPMLVASVCLIRGFMQVPFC